MSEELRSGKIIADRYEVLYQAGKGSQATVYCCKDRKLGSLQVALKVFHQQNYDPKGIHAEILAAIRVDHDNVVRLYDVVYTHDILAIVIEWCPGKNLLEFIREHGKKLSVSRAVNILRQIATALDAIHSKDILHRDLKPENIIILGDDRVKVSDFGISDLQKDPELKNTQKKFGTPYFLPLEYLQDGILGARTDIYAFGLCAYELLTANRAFRQEKLEKLLREKLKTPEKRPSLLRNNIPEDLDNLCVACCSEDPSKRPENAREVLTVLKKVLSELHAESQFSEQSTGKSTQRPISTPGNKLWGVLTTPTPFLYLNLLQLFAICIVLLLLMKVLNSL